MKLEDQLREVLRKKQYSRRTEENYTSWYRRFVLWHKERDGTPRSGERAYGRGRHHINDITINRGARAQCANG